MYVAPTLRHVRLVPHAVLAAAVAGDPHEPARERRERRLEGLSGAGQRVGAIAAPVPRRGCQSTTPDQRCSKA